MTLKKLDFYIYHIRSPFMIYTFTDKEDFGETRVESTLPAKPQSVKTCHKPQLLHRYIFQPTRPST